MVTVTRESTVVDAKLAEDTLKLAKASFAFYEQAEPTADLRAAKGHLRNSLNWLGAKHYAAAYRDAQRAIEATNEAVCLAVRERFDLESGSLRTNIEEARRLYRPVPELDDLENSLANLEQELLRLRPAVIHYCSREIFVRILLLTSRFTRCLNALRLGQIQRERFETKAEKISNLLREIKDRCPQANGIERERLEEELEERKAAFAAQPSEQVWQGSGIRDLEDLFARAEEFRTRVLAAFRPPSSKSVPQRGRKRVRNKSSRGPGRHGRH